MKKKFTLLYLNHPVTEEILLIMRLTVFLLVISVFSAYSNTFAQKTKINLQIQNKEVKNVLKEIEVQSDFYFMYNNKEVDVERKVDLTAKSLTIEEVLRKLFNGTSTNYKIVNQQILLFPEAQIIVSPQQQKIKITGTVTDDKGTTLPGVSVRVKGTSIGVITDENGKYTITIPESAKTLIYSSVGLKLVEVAINGQKTINVEMESEAIKLDDVVIVAFGKQKKTEVVGAVTSIRPADLKIPTSNLTTALAGKLAGIIAYQRSGEPGADNADFFIRGVTTFGYRKSPLILIDNIESSTDDLAKLQVDDISNFSIMKDATSTALYGARGANGVILITTKEGREGKMNLSIRVENSVSSSTKNVEIADPITYMKLANEATLTRNPIGGLFYTQTKIDNTQRGMNKYYYPATDWQKELLKDYTMNQRVNLNLSGGGKIARYFVSGSANKDNGILKVDQRNNFNSNANLQSYSLRTNVNINLTKTTELIAKISGTFNDYTGPITGGTDIYNQIMHSNPVLFPAYYPVDKDHQFVQHIMFGNFGQNAQYNNPYASLEKGYKDYASSTMDAQFQVLQDLSFITKGLSARALVNTSRYSYFDVSRFYNPYYYSAYNYDRIADTYSLSLLNESSGTEYLGYSEGTKTVKSSVYGEAALTYKQVFNKVHSVSGMLVGILRNELIGNAGDLQTSLPFRNLGLSGRTTYVYNDIYSAEINFGYNGSERFYKNHRYGFFPSAGLAYTISNEKFWKPLKEIISEMKVRATYGFVGNDQIGSSSDRFFYLSNVNMNNGSYGSVFGENNSYSRNGISISRYANTDISWEKSRKMNLGLETKLFGVFGIQADYFTEYRTNILMDRTSIPITMGLSAKVRANVGEASSKGFEFSLDYSKSFNEHFWMKSMGNFTYATSKYEIYEEPQYAETYKLHPGYSISQQWGYIAERLFIDNYDVANNPKQNFGEYGQGDIKYKDVNGDGKITTLDMVPIGQPTSPEIVYGFGLSAGYKRFDISCFFQGLGRESFWIDANATSPFVGNQTQLLKAYADDHWSEENKNLYALWPRLSPTVNNNNTQTSTWFMRNGAFLRLKSLEVGFTLTDNMLKKFHLANARFYLNGTNLFMWSKFKLWDTEMGGNGLGYPVQKVINFGLTIGIN